VRVAGGRAGTGIPVIAAADEPYAVARGRGGPVDGPAAGPYRIRFPLRRSSAMTFEEAVTELRARHPEAELSPAAARGAAGRAGRVEFRRGKGGVYAGRDADGTEVLVYHNDTAGLIALTELCPDARADASDDD
jgi:hypothetical protein